MKKLIIILGILAFNVGVAQNSGKVTSLAKLENGNITVEGIDALGADVSITYNQRLEKIYIEREINGERVFAKFDDGRVIEYGFIVKPTLAASEFSPGLRAER